MQDQNFEYLVPSHLFTGGTPSPQAEQPAPQHEQDSESLVPDEFIRRNQARPRHEGFWEGFGLSISETDWKKKLPYLGGAFEAEEMHTLWSAAKRVEEGKETPEDQALLVAFMEKSQEQHGIGYTVAEIITALPGFMIEFGTSAGAAACQRSLITARHRPRSAPAG